MVEFHVLNRLRALAEHRRWLVGLAHSARYGRLTAGLLAVEGSGLSSRAELVAHRGVRLSDDITRSFGRLRIGRGSRAPDAALFAARLAESQAALLDDFAAEVAPVWNRVSAVAVHGPGLWRRSAGLIGYAGLCDAARLADLTGMNVIDGFACRDIAQDGRGAPLLPLPMWLLLRDLRRPRAVVHVGRRRVSLTCLAPSRDVGGAARTHYVRIAVDPNGADPQPAAETVVRIAGEFFAPHPMAGQLVWCGPREPGGLIDAVNRMLRDVRVVAPEELGIASGALRSATVAVLGLFHLDQVPGNLCRATGAHTPRVLGRVTPGSVVNWQRLLRDLAARRPAAVSLRSAM